MLYRDVYRKDIFINLISYRKYGHNELDEPSFTQPLMYNVIRSKYCPVESFFLKLLDEGVVNKYFRDQIVQSYISTLKKDLDDVDTGKTSPKADHLKGIWTSFKQAPAEFTTWDTGVDTDLLNSIGIASVTCPPDFSAHQNIKKTHIDGRLKKLSQGQIDWSTAEALAFGSILIQGFDVRISGQDVGRGTFSQRHAMIVDQKTDLVHIPLNNISQEQTGFLEIANSPLSEAAILGFEYGFSIENPHRLVIWEAQFGDFYNGAQVQIDTLLASGESKWLHQNGLVVLLPHGFDGAGPDHSSAHIERFLQLTDSRENTKESADGHNVNMFITNPTTSAQYFHLLRRQIVAPYRKPMVIIAPKILLRHPASVSDISELAPGKTFESVLVDKAVEPNEVEKVILSSGKHAIMLMEERKMRCITTAAILRLEEICPFPILPIEKAIRLYPKAKKFIWSQEEPRNSGPWNFVSSRFRSAFGIELSYVGRGEIAFMANPISEIHNAEINKIFTDTFN